VLGEGCPGASISKEIEALVILGQKAVCAVSPLCSRDWAIDVATKLLVGLANPMRRAIGSILV
ncbi:MAG: hypothetical protein WBD59_21020, partial [Candidatus Sulfotelmatobacter sp.]